MKDEVMQVIDDARQLLIKPEAWTNCFGLGQDTDGVTTWDVWQPEDLDSDFLYDDKYIKMSLCGALELAAHRRKYPKAVMDAVVLFLYPLAWKQILAPYPYPHELIESHTDGDHYLYEELGYFNESRTHAEVVGLLNTALAHIYAKTIPSLPTQRQAMLDAFVGLMEENKRKSIE